MNLAILHIFIIVLAFPKGKAELQEDYCVSGAYPPKDRAVGKQHELNLDLPPLQRWKQLGALQKDELQAILTQFKSVLLSISAHAQMLIQYVDKNFGALVELMPHPYNEEMRGFAEAAQVNLGELFVYNIFYEFFTVCTSVVARDDQGHIYHARNLDFGIFMGWDTKKDKWLMSELLRNSTFHLQWTKAGKPLFKSVNFAGYIGILTGLKPGKFAFSLDERFNVDGGFLGLLKWVLGYRDSAWITFLSRRIMETCDSYEEARDILTDTELIAPIYFILSGSAPHQACVITRSRTETLNVWQIGTNGYNLSAAHNNINYGNNIIYNNNGNNNDNYDHDNLESNIGKKANFKAQHSQATTKHRAETADTKLHFRSSKKAGILASLKHPSKLSESCGDPYFFLLETNYDHWTTPPFYDDRRTTALHCLNQLTNKNINFAHLFDLLSTKPMLNKLTVYTSLMHVASGKMESYIQDCSDPCPPW